jgi:hypothetical protein
MYFLVEKYKTCFELMDTRLYDTLGVNFNIVTKNDMFSFDENEIGNGFYSGNFWWSNHIHINNLPPLLIYIKDGKHFSEYWLFTYNETRILNLFHLNETIQLYIDKIPRYLYENKENEYQIFTIN